MHGPKNMPGGSKGSMPGGIKGKPGKTLKRTLGYMLVNYKLPFAIVVACILITAFATLEGTLFMQKLIDDYILPMTREEVPDFTPLMHALVKLAGIFGIGVISALTYNKIMVYISQGTMRKLLV